MSEISQSTKLKAALLSIGCVGAQASLDMALLADRFMRVPHAQPQPQKWRGQGMRRMKRVK